MESSEFNYKLSITAIMKYEEDYVLEWVAYHHCIGVDHFYIYDNDENSRMEEVLRKYIDAGIVTLNHAPGPVMMFKCYNDAIEKYKNESKYIAFIDADEFLMPVEDVNIYDVIDDLITNYHSTNSRVEGLTIKWATYGSGHHMTKPQGLMIESYLYKTDDEKWDRHVKTVLNPRKVFKFANPHYPHYSDHCISVDETGLASIGPFQYGDKRNKLRINHYYYKSREEFMRRINRGKCDIKISEEEMKKFVEEQLPAHEASNKIYDDIMLRYIDRVKSEMNKYRN